jgi:hypothetical protein
MCHGSKTDIQIGQKRFGSNWSDGRILIYNIYNRSHNRLNTRTILWLMFWEQYKKQLALRLSVENCQPWFATVQTTRHYETIPEKVYFKWPTWKGLTFMCTRYRTWLTHYDTNQKVAGSVPDKVTGFFNWQNPSSRTMALEYTQPLTEMSTRNLPVG